MTSRIFGMTPLVFPNVLVVGDRLLNIEACQSNFRGLTAWVSFGVLSSRESLAEKLLPVVYCFMATQVSSYLGPDSEILVWHKIWSDSILVSICMWHEDVNVGQHDHGESHEEGQVTPHLPTAIYNKNI